MKNVAPPQCHNARCSGSKLGTKLPDWIVRKAMDILVARRELEEAEMMKAAIQ